MPHDYMIISLC